MRTNVHHSNFLSFSHIRIKSSSKHRRKNFESVKEKGGGSVTVLQHSVVEGHINNLTFTLNVSLAKDDDHPQL